MDDPAHAALAHRMLPRSPRLLRQIALAELLGPPPAVERRRMLLARARGEVEAEHAPRRGRLD